SLWRGRPPVCRTSGVGWLGSAARRADALRRAATAVRLILRAFRVRTLLFRAARFWGATPGILRIVSEKLVGRSRRPSELDSRSSCSRPHGRGRVAAVVDPDPPILRVAPRRGVIPAAGPQRAELVGLDRLPRGGGIDPQEPRGVEAQDLL